MRNIGRRQTASECNNEKTSSIHYRLTITIRKRAGELSNSVTKPSMSNHKQTTLN